MIERSHLQILFEIDRQGSMTAAAQSLHLTQSALSHTMKKLESQIGAQLWEKRGRQLELTELGQFLLREAQRLLPQLERIDSAMKQMARGDIGSLHIGMECHPCYQWLMSFVGAFLEKWPGVEVDVRQRFQFGGLAALFSREIDILVTPDPLDKKGVNFYPVFDYEQVLVISNQHAFAEREWIGPQELANEVLYTYPVERDRLDIFSEFLNPAKCSTRQHKHIEATEMMLQLVAAGRGVATLPRWLVELHQSTLPICAVSLGENGLRKSIHLGLREGHRPKFVDAFLESALQAEH